MSVSSSSTLSRLEKSLSGQTVVESPSEVELNQGEGRLSIPQVRSSSRSTVLHATSFLQPWNPRLIEQIISNTHDLRSESNVRVLKIAGQRTNWWPNVSDVDFHRLLVRDASKPSTQPKHTLFAFFVHLEYKHEEQYQRQASISKESLQKLAGYFKMHNAAVQDMFRRPDYWSPVGRYKDIQGERSAGYEFFCQHPR